MAKRHTVTDLDAAQADYIRTGFRQAGFKVTIYTASEVTDSWELDGSIGEGVFGTRHEVVELDARPDPDGGRDFVHKIEIVGEGAFYAKVERFDLVAVLR